MDTTTITTARCSYIDRNGDRCGLTAGHLQQATTSGHTIYVIPDNADLAIVNGMAWTVLAHTTTGIRRRNPYTGRDVITGDEPAVFVARDGWQTRTVPVRNVTRFIPATTATVSA